ncbi:MAG TPA: tripartite tricarboxylate transporter substrate binding protein [Xanthobacteraceae bacterium]|jgi:tripartite-type tricarboxylate transporter receptor subunit TctC|nr:tripartite tricarboxylate transporter substrate binding protein [Xanthobacteraceae bacterium]
MLGRFQFTFAAGAFVAAAGLVALTGPGGRAFADDSYPDRPIRVIVSVPAGGGVDTVTRIVTDKMRVPLGQPLIVENKSGVGGSIAAETVFKSDPDGYTILASQPSPITTNPVLYKSLNYDPAQLAPIAIMSHIPNVVLVRKDFPANTVQELIAYAKANPGKVNYASQGIGTTSHTTAELFQTITGTKLTHVPYKGTAPAINDLLAGNVDLMFNELASSLELYKNGNAKILAVTVKDRVPSLPDIPTLEEAGVHGCISDTWHALTAPPKTPEAVIAKLNAAANAAMHDPTLLERYKALSISPGGGTPAEAAAFIKQETQRWDDVIRAAGIQPQ